MKATGVLKGVACHLSLKRGIPSNVFFESVRELASFFFKPPIESWRSSRKPQYRFLSLWFDLTQNRISSLLLQMQDCRCYHSTTCTASGSIGNFTPGRSLNCMLRILLIAFCGKYGNTRQVFTHEIKVLIFGACNGKILTNRRWAGYRQCMIASLVLYRYFSQQVNVMWESQIAIFCLPVSFIRLNEIDYVMFEFLVKSKQMLKVFRFKSIMISEELYRVTQKDAYP